MSKNETMQYSEVVGVASKLDLWQENMRNPLIQELKKGKNLAEALKAMPGFNEAFCDLDTILCSDGRVLGGKKIGLAGSGVLFSPEDRTAFIQANKGKAKLVTSHEDCGAAADAFKSLVENRTGLTADEYGRECAESMADDLNADHKYLPMEEMAEERHNEAGLTIDGTGRFDSTNLKDFPPHFTCTAAGLGVSDAYVLKEATILIGIAMEGHGFGKLFTEEDPFRLMIIAKDNIQAEHYLTLLKPIVAKYDGRIKADSVIHA